MGRTLSTLVALVLTLAACEPEDLRKPFRPQAPTVPNVPAPQVSDPSVIPAPGEGDPAAVEEDRPTTPLIDGRSHALKMLNEPEWDSAQRLKDFCRDSLVRAGLVRTRLQGPMGSEDAVVKAFNQLSLELDTADGLVSLMFNVNPHVEVRDVAQQCQQDLSKFVTDVGLDRKLFDALDAVKLEGLAPLAKRFVTRSLRDFKRSGVDKDEPTRKRIAQINAMMVEVGQRYRKNITEDVRSITIDDRKSLAGLPQDWIDAHLPKEEGEKIVVTTDYPDFFPFQTYVADGELRKKLYQEFSSRAFPKNAELIKKMLVLRKELTTLLGYENWADYATEDKMTGSAEVVDAFIKGVEQVVRPRNDRDVAVLLERKRQDLPDAKAIESYDRFYYVSKVREDAHGFDSKAVRPYFSYPRVEAGIFALYGDLFGLSFHKLDDVKAWHPSVSAYEMRADGQLVGRFFLDMHPRPDKYKHAAMFPIQTGLDGDRIPWGALVCNFSDPSTGNGKALMEHNQVVTYFHEFGHLIHHLLARRGTFIDLSGINVEWDFVEAPSQILEEWAWDTDVLQRFAKHVDTDEPIPAKLVEKMRAADEFGRGLSLMRQVFYTAYSFYLHTQDPADLDLVAFTEGIYDKYSPFPPLEGAHIYANFGHLIGYSAIYYTYQWSLAIAKDLFTRFQAKGLLDKEVALAYRKEILEPGGTADAKDLVENFLGRARNLDAYRNWIQRQAD